MAFITSCEVDYVGSIAVCPKLIRASGLLINEKVQVLNFENGSRFETYVIEGKSCEIGLRGPAAKLGKVGDRLIILAYAHLSLPEADGFSPKVVFVDEKNKVKN